MCELPGEHKAAIKGSREGPVLLQALSDSLEDVTLNSNIHELDNDLYVFLSLCSSLLLVYHRLIGVLK